MRFISFFFFFKQKTAYEMRISDWSSDVCSSDLGAIGTRAEAILAHGDYSLSGLDQSLGDAQGILRATSQAAARDRALSEHMLEATQASGEGLGQLSDGLARATTMRERSEEHTSEIQSLMSITDADF